MDHLIPGVFFVDAFYSRHLHFPYFCRRLTENPHPPEHDSGQRIGRVIRKGKTGNPVLDLNQAAYMMNDWQAAGQLGNVIGKAAWFVAGRDKEKIACRIYPAGQGRIIAVQQTDPAFILSFLDQPDKGLFQFFDATAKNKDLEFFISDQ